MKATGSAVELLLSLDDDVSLCYYNYSIKSLVSKIPHRHHGNILKAEYGAVKTLVAFLDTSLCVANSVTALPRRTVSDRLDPACL